MTLSLEGDSIRPPMTIKEVEGPSFGGRVDFAEHHACEKGAT